MVTERDLENAKKIYDYMQVNERLDKCDCILGLGSSNDNVAKRCAELYFLGYSDKIIFSGGTGKITRSWEWQTESEHFKTIAVDLGVPKSSIFIETQSTNLGDNFMYTDDLIHHKHLKIKSLLIVSKPGVQRRVRAAFDRQLPIYSAIVTAPKMTFEQNLIYYYSHDLPLKEVISLLVGDLQRLHVYYLRGFQKFVDIPVEFLSVYNELVANGYGKYTI